MIDGKLRVVSSELTQQTAGIASVVVQHAQTTAQRIDADVIVRLDGLKKLDDLLLGVLLIGQFRIQGIEQNHGHGARGAGLLLQVVSEHVGRKLDIGNREDRVGLHLEEADLLRFAVIEDLEIGGFQIGNGLAAAAHDRVDLDEARGRLECQLLTILGRLLTIY